MPLSKCAKKRRSKLVTAETLYWLAILLIFIGVAVVLIATVLLCRSNFKGEGKTKGGGAIIIGPVPIVFGTDKESVKTVLTLSLVLTIVLVVAMTAYYLMYR